ncbi:hypothetical protein LWF15_19070 [Kineosporia rhizophila]|uniref:DUF7660 family protein n=1 Tax=Kineosporia TaxID=49184 RepID=UPI000A3E2CE4|nr:MULTISPECIES: hypothetical protein [Kineosporia]MCE0537595.1 hypothetical protein [Kineosporia rhizophila]GLY18891.1 hypothetical protein Kisp01_59050 [Kineosporia sp. NBRC 101677]
MIPETGRSAAVSPEQTSAVRSMADLARVVRQMHDDLVGSGEQEWENPTLEGFLEALAAVAEDRVSPDAPTWAHLAELLVAATGYE